MICEHKRTHHSGCDDCLAVWCWVCAGYHEPLSTRVSCAEKLRARVAELEAALTKVCSTHGCRCDDFWFEGVNDALQIITKLRDDEAARRDAADKAVLSTPSVSEAICVDCGVSGTADAVVASEGWVCPKCREPRPSEPFMRDHAREMVEALEGLQAEIVPLPRTNDAPPSVCTGCDQVAGHSGSCTWTEADLAKVKADAAKLEAELAPKQRASEATCISPGCPRSPLAGHMHCGVPHDADLESKFATGQRIEHRATQRTSEAVGKHAFRGVFTCEFCGEARGHAAHDASPKFCECSPWTNGACDLGTKCCYVHRASWQCANEAMPSVSTGLWKCDRCLETFDHQVQLGLHQMNNCPVDRHSPALEQRSSEALSRAYHCHGYAIESGKKCPQCGAPAPLDGSRTNEARPDIVFSQDLPGAKPAPRVSVRWRLRQVAKGTLDADREAEAMGNEIAALVEWARDAGPVRVPPPAERPDGEVERVHKAIEAWADKMRERGVEKLYETAARYHLALTIRDLLADERGQRSETPVPTDLAERLVMLVGRRAALDLVAVVPCAVETSKASETGSTGT